MIADGELPSRPDDSARLAARIAPSRGLVMYQRWTNLLFLHWKYPAELIQRELPNGLFVDLHEGEAYLGVVPFFMKGIRPRFLPAVWGLSNFMELNLRTYVYDRQGVPGVWFFSLDANQRLAVAMARRFFHLPYFLAEMDSSPGPNEGIRYRSKRYGEGLQSGDCRYEYSIGDVLPEPKSDSLEFFLVERYRLYAAGKGELWRGAVSHHPYALHKAKLAFGDDKLLEVNGLDRAQRPPDHVIASPGVKVSIYALEPVASVNR